MTFPMLKSKNGGSNCSRFVNTGIRAGNLSWLATFKLNFLVPLTPSPLNNVHSFPNKTILPKLLPFTFTPSPISEKSKLKGTLSEPERAAEIPQTSQWLAGEGAGSWFNILPAVNEAFEITRFSPEGTVECKNFFHLPKIINGFPQGFTFSPSFFEIMPIFDSII